MLRGRALCEGTQEAVFWFVSRSKGSHEQLCEGMQEAVFWFVSRNKGSHEHALRCSVSVLVSAIRDHQQSVKKEGKYEEAIRAYSEAISLCPVDVPQREGFSVPVITMGLLHRMGFEPDSGTARL